MIKLLQIKNYHFLGLLIGVPFIVTLLITIFSLELLFIVAIPFLLTFCFVLYFGWHWSAAVNLHRQLSATLWMKIDVFKIAFCFFVLYFIVSCSAPFLGDTSLTFIWVFRILKYVGSFSIFYCVGFIAKALNQVENNQPAKFKDYVADFFLILMFPIGIFAIQPRLNEIFEKRRINICPRQV